MTMNSVTDSPEGQASTPKKRGHKGTFVLSCVIITIAYMAIEGEPPGITHGAILFIPVLILTAILDLILDAIQGQNKKS